MGNAQEKADLEESLLRFASSTPQNSPLIQIHINYSANVSHSISFPSKNTCKMLYIEAIRLAKNNRIPNYQDIIALESTNSNEMIDFWLMEPEFTLEKFDHDKCLYLQAVFKPKNQIFHKNKFELKDFRFLKCIGKGGTSLVSLVRYMKTGHLFALKQIPKPLLQDPRRLKQIMVERDVLNRLDCPFLADLICAFESENFLNFLMEYYPGGELFFHLKKMKFTEEVARFYFVQIIFSLEFLHSQKILYRDLKPENLILDINGYIRLTDFGLCKKGLESQELTHSFCGSPEYMAPEIINHSGHSYTVDFYTLGALLYEFTTGLPPFYSKNPMEIIANINKGILKIPEKLSEELKNLLKKLLIKNPLERLKDFVDLRNDPWLKGVDWQAIYEKKLVAPIHLDLYQTNIHQEFSKIAISMDAMKENENFNRDYPNFEYNSPVFLLYFESPFFSKKDLMNNFVIEKMEKRISSLPTNKKIPKTVTKNERKQSVVQEKTGENIDDSRVLMKYIVKLPLKAKATLTKNNLLNSTFNGTVNRNLSITSFGHLTNRMNTHENQEKKRLPPSNIMLRNKKTYGKENRQEISIKSPDKENCNTKTSDKKLYINNATTTKEKTLKKPESVEKTKEKTINTLTKKISSEKKISGVSILNSNVPVGSQITKFLGNKKLMQNKFDSGKDNSKANISSSTNLNNDTQNKASKNYKIISKNLK